NTKNLLGATSLAVAGLALSIPYALHINENNKTINQESSSLNLLDEENNNTRAIFEGTLLNKEAVEQLGWDTKTNISLTDWADAPNVVEIKADAATNGPFWNNRTINSIVIPSRVTLIGDNAFASSTLSSITFENGSRLTHILDSAFAITNSLKSIDIPDSVVELGNNIFFGLSTGSGLEQINFSQNSRLTKIGATTFQFSLLTSINLPDTVNSIGFNAFADTSNLTGSNVSMSETLKGANPNEPKYGFTQAQWDIIDWREATQPFEGVNLTKQAVTSIHWNAKATITLADWTEWAPNVTRIDANAFEDLGLSSIQIPDKVTLIGASAFKNTSSLTTVTLNSTSKLTSIGNNAFEASKISSINIPNTVTSIGASAFKGLSSLLTVSLDSDASKLTSIGNYAFEGSAISSITLPNLVKTVGTDAFKSTNSLTSITLPYALYKEATTPPYGFTTTQWNSIVWNNIPKEGKINKIIAKELLKSDPKITWARIEKYSEIEKEAFMGTNITELTIDYKSGFKIGDDAFKNTSSLTKITLDASYEPSVSKWGLT
ncbi:MAG: leucine-rich repeat protein, partial [Metamycoplasmataceae bacterium]